MLPQEVKVCLILNALMYCTSVINVIVMGVNTGCKENCTNLLK